MSLLTRLKEIVFGEGVNYSAIDKSYEDAAARVIQSSRDLRKIVTSSTKSRQDDEFDKFVAGMRTSGSRRKKNGVSNGRRIRKGASSE